MKSLVEVAPSALRTIRQHASKEFTKKQMGREAFLELTELLDKVETVIGKNSHQDGAHNGEKEKQSVA